MSFSGHGFNCGSWKVIVNYVYGEKSLRIKTDEDEQSKTTKRNQETDFHSVEINSAHFDTRIRTLYHGKLKKITEKVMESYRF